MAGQSSTAPKAVRRHPGREWTGILPRPRLQAMHRPRRFNRVIALAAAYAVALQAVLLPLSVAIGSSPVLCLSSGSGGGSQAPAGHSPGCPCAAGCGMHCGIHVAAAPPESLPTFLFIGAGRSLPLPAMEQAQAHALRRPQLARAPPAA